MGFDLLDTTLESPDFGIRELLPDAKSGNIEELVSTENRTYTYTLDSFSIEAPDTPNEIEYTGRIHMREPKGLRLRPPHEE